jgi:hypothetical protein
LARRRAGDEHDHLKARIASRALIGVGLFLAWLGLLLPWQSWSSLAEDGSMNGFAVSRPLWIGLAVTTVLAVVALRRGGRWPFAALAALAFVLAAIVVSEIAANLDAGSAFVALGPGVGALVSLAGVLVLLCAALTVLRPGRLQLAAVILGFGLLAWAQAGGGPAGGGISDAADDAARAIAFEGDTLYRVDGGLLVAQPAPEREYGALGLWTSDWSPDDPDFHDYSGHSIAFAGDTLYVMIGGVDRLVAIEPDGTRRILVARRPAPQRDEPPLPGGQSPEVLEQFFAGPIATAPDGTLYLLLGDRVARWADGRLETVAEGFNSAQDLAVGPDGAIYVADTGNGRVERIEPGGDRETVVGTEAAPGCVEEGLDDPLALDVRRCNGANALAVDGDGNLYLAQRGIGRIVGVTPEGRMAVVAGEGPMGWRDGDGRAVRARLGQVIALATGPDGDLYLGQTEPLDRIRRVADPAGILADEPQEPEAPDRGPACAAIARTTEASAGIGDLARSLEALRAEVSGEVEEVEAIEDGLDFDVQMDPNPFEEGLDDYAEEECGLAAGFDVPVDEANEFCVAYQRYLDLGHDTGGGPPEALAEVRRSAPRFLADADVETVDTVAFSMCALS